MVTILSVGLIELKRTEQERTTCPFRCTEQAPHCATPQPYLVPVRPTCSRMTHSSGVLGSACTSRVFPLMFSLAMLFSSVGSCNSIRVNATAGRMLPPLRSPRDGVGAGGAHGEKHRGNGQ